MTKRRGKAKVAASNVPSKVEEVSGNDLIAESAPSEAVEIEEAATTMVFYKPEEVDKKEENEDVPDESEEVDEIEECEDDPDESQDVDEIGESEDDPDESEEEDEIEESEDHLDKSEDGDKKEKTTYAFDKSEEGDEEETKEYGKVPEGEKVEEGDVTEEVKDNGKEENVPDKKAKKMRKKNKKSAAGAATLNDVNKSNDADKQETSAGEKKDSKKAAGMGLIFMCNAKTKMDCFRYKVFGLPASKKETVAKIYKGMRLFLFDVDLKLMYGIYKAASSGGYNIEPKAFKSAFPSQVRFSVLNDCLPLPEEKFKAAIKGNYYGKNKFNCELSPEQVKNLCKLFQSAGKASEKKRPREVSRVVPEQISSARGRNRSRHERERWDDKIPRGRDLYSRRETYAAPPPRSREVIRAEPGTSSTQGRKRSRHERGREGDSIPRARDVYARREAYASPPPRSLALPPPMARDLYARREPPPMARDLYARREPYASPPPRSLALPPPQPPPIPYGQSVDEYYYKREPPLLDPRDRRIMDLEARLREYETLGNRDPYSVHREALSREPILHHGSLYPTSLTPAAPPSLHYRY